jgi:hypothetical protein
VILVYCLSTVERYHAVIHSWLIKTVSAGLLLGWPPMESRSCCRDNEGLLSDGRALLCWVLSRENHVPSHAKKKIRLASSLLFQRIYMIINSVFLLRLPSNTATWCALFYRVPSVYSVAEADLASFRYVVQDRHRSALLSLIHHWGQTTTSSSIASSVLRV